MGSCGVVGSAVASYLKGCEIDSALGPITTIAQYIRRICFVHTWLMTMDQAYTLGCRALY